jgi:hypothetical protein
MASVLGGKKDVKIFVLFLMENINYPLDFISINDIVMQTDYFMYLDFAEAFDELLEADLIMCELDDGEKYYSVTDKGRIVARELSGNMLSSILDKSLEMALRYLDFKKRGIESRCEYMQCPNGKFELTCTLLERREKIFETTIIVDSEERARQMRQRYLDRPDVVYRGMVALLAGKMEFLFN